MGLIMVCYSGLHGILSGLTKSADHPSSAMLRMDIRFYVGTVLKPIRSPYIGSATPLSYMDVEQ